MRLIMTLPADCNSLGCEFADAYWSITEVGYDMENCYFVLDVFPSKDHKYINGATINQTSLKVGGATSTIFNTLLYRQKGPVPIKEIFPTGIPLDPNIQKTTLYNWIKSYAEVSFKTSY